MDEKDAGREEGEGRIREEKRIRMRKGSKGVENGDRKAGTEEGGAQTWCVVEKMKGGLEE